jgi:hypothetical protein
VPQTDPRRYPILRLKRYLYADGLFLKRKNMPHFYKNQEKKKEFRSRYAKDLDISSSFACPDQHENLLKPGGCVRCA